VRKWLVAVMATAFVVGGLVGCEPAEETGGGKEGGTKVTAGDTAKEPGTATMPGTEKPASVPKAEGDN